MKTAIDASYLDEHVLDELADHITEAARRAADDAAKRVSELMVPISERCKAFPALSEIVAGARICETSWQAGWMVLPASVGRIPTAVLAGKARFPL